MGCVLQKFNPSQVWLLLKTGLRLFRLLNFAIGGFSSFLRCLAVKSAKSLRDPFYFNEITVF